jgi:hypothetical protein
VSRMRCQSRSVGGRDANDAMPAMAFSRRTRTVARARVSAAFLTGDAAAVAGALLAPAVVVVTGLSAAARA